MNSVSKKDLAYSKYGTKNLSRRIYESNIQYWSFRIDPEGAKHYYTKCELRTSRFCKKCRKFKDNLQEAMKWLL